MIKTPTEFPDKEICQMNINLNIDYLKTIGFKFSGKVSR